MRFFESRREWLKAIQRPKLIIVITSLIRRIFLENDLYERQEGESVNN